MKKTQLTERFQELAGIKEINVTEMRGGPMVPMGPEPGGGGGGVDIPKPGPWPKQENVGYEGLDSTHPNDPLLKEELFTALAGMAGILGMAGVTGQIQAAMEDPAIAEKYPALAKIFGFLTKIGGDVGAGIK